VDCSSSQSAGVLNNAHCSKIDDIRALESLINLTLCALDSVSNLRDFAVLGDMPELTELSISGFRLGTPSVIPRLDRMRVFSFQEAYSAILIDG
jgi:hypothetical protein